MAGDRREGVLLWRNGKLVLEEYFYGYDRDRPHQIRSATKSFISTLAGIAIDQGSLVAVFTGGNYYSPTDTSPNEIMGTFIIPQLARD